MWGPGLTYRERARRKRCMTTGRQVDEKRIKRETLNCKEEKKNGMEKERMTASINTDGVSLVQGFSTPATCVQRLPRDFKSYQKPLNSMLTCMISSLSTVSS